VEHLARASIAACGVAVVGLIYTILPYTKTIVPLVVAAVFVLTLAGSFMRAEFKRATKSDRGPGR